MKKSERLQVIVDLQAQQERQALENLAVCQKQLTAMESQLHTVQNYRQEYLQKYSAAENKTSNITRLLDFRAFIAKLDAAVTGQEQSIEQKKRELQRLQKHWQQKHHKTEGIRKISERAASEESKLLEKQEQREQDEQAARSASKGGTGTA
jgi:flagellar protein FliJ